MVAKRLLAGRRPSERGVLPVTDAPVTARPDRSTAAGVADVTAAWLPGSAPALRFGAVRPGPPPGSNRLLPQSRRPPPRPRPQPPKNPLRPASRL